MPTLKQDPLFHGPDEPCLLHYPQFDGMVGRGTVIVCPGGNYEFLSPLEGLPVVEWSIALAASLEPRCLLPRGRQRRQRPLPGHASAF